MPTSPSSSPSAVIITNTITTKDSCLDGLLFRNDTYHHHHHHRQDDDDDDHDVEKTAASLLLNTCFRVFQLFPSFYHYNRLLKCFSKSLSNNKFACLFLDFIVLASLNLWLIRHKLVYYKEGFSIARPRRRQRSSSSSFLLLFASFSLFSPLL